MSEQTDQPQDTQPIAPEGTQKAVPAVVPVPTRDVTPATPRPKRVRLTHRQRVFIAEYVRTWNGAKAARLAGYTPRSAEVMSCKMLKAPKIIGEIDARLKRLHVTPEQVLSRLGEMASVNIADFVQADGTANWKTVEERGYLVKSFESTKHGHKLELHDALRALELIGKAHKLFGNDSAQANVAVQFIVSGVSADKI